MVLPFHSGGEQDIVLLCHAHLNALTRPATKVDHIVLPLLIELNVRVQSTRISNFLEKVVVLSNDCEFVRPIVEIGGVDLAPRQKSLFVVHL